jgi:leucine dehydrogenase
LNLGGGNCCLLVDPNLKEGREKLFEQFGHCLNHLGGRYITAEDMGTSVEDIGVMRKVSRFAAGYSQSEGGSGDPSPWTARGVYKSILAACERMYGSQDLQGKRVAVQGIGHVGKYLCAHLAEAGAKLIVSDTNQQRVEQAASEYGAEVVHLEAIYDVDCDVYAPCAVGQTVNDSTIPRLSCKIIAGAANNVLSSREVLPELRVKGILYCPDFVINSGGVISVGAEYNNGGWDQKWVTEKVDNIFNTLNSVLDKAEQSGKHAEDVAIELAKERIAKAGGTR